jgi:hypothetical protein
MTRVPIKILATAAFSSLLVGCATTIEAGPGYYHYDTGLARPSAPPVVYQEPAVIYREPAVTYREPAVVYRNPPVVYSKPGVVYRDSTPSVFYRSGRDVLRYNDHGQ